jgi:hypothetical protein
MNNHGTMAMLSSSQTFQTLRGSERCSSAIRFIIIALDGDVQTMGLRLTALDPLVVFIDPRLS